MPQNLQNFAEFLQKLLIFQTDFLVKILDCSGAKVCKSCRASKMLSNAYFLAKFRFDTAENEPAKNLQKFSNFPNFANPNPCRRGTRDRARWSPGANRRPGGAQKQCPLSSKDTPPPRSLSIKEANE